MANFDPTGTFQPIIDKTNTDATNQVNSFNQNYSTGLSNLQNQQKGETADYLGRYTTAVNNLPNEQQLYQQIGTQNNLPGLQKLASQANIAVSNIPRDELDYARYNGGGGEIDNNQLQQLIQQKLYDLAPIAQRATQQYQDAADFVNQQMQYAIDQQNRSLLPFQQEGSLLGDRLNREMTGFTAQNEAALNALTAKLNTTGSLTQAEMNQMAQLAYQENEFHNQQALQSQQAALGLSNSNAETNYNLRAQGYTPFSSSNGSGGGNTVNYSNASGSGSTIGNIGGTIQGIDYTRGFDPSAAFNSGGLKR